MRVLVLGINYWPEETGIGPCTTALCEYLAARGHQVTVATALPYYPEWRVPAQYRWRLGDREIRNGVEILRSWLYVPRRVTPKRRILHEASFIGSVTLKAFAAGRRERPDVILAVSPPLGLTLSAIMLARKWQIPFALQVEDLQPDAALDLGMIKRGRAAKILLKIERAAYRHAGLISTLTSGMRSRILSKGVPANKVVTIPHGVDSSLFKLPLTGAGEAVRKRFGLAGKFLVLHSGNMGVKQGLEVILGAAERSRRYADIVYLLVGDGAARSALQDRAARIGLNNVRFLPVQPREIFHELLAATNVALITQRGSVADIVFPSKTQTLLASGRPVIASVNAASEVAKAIREANAGLVVPPEQPEALLEAVLKLKGDSVLRMAMARKGREYAQKHWSQETVLVLMERKLCELAGAPTPAIQESYPEAEQTVASNLPA